MCNVFDDRVMAMVLQSAQLLEVYLAAYLGLPSPVRMIANLLVVCVQFIQIAHRLVRVENQ